jgi:Pentapeptide repeats (8 copies)
MLVREPRKRPEPWTQKKAAIRHRWLLPVHTVNWFSEWLAHVLGNWVFLEVLEYLGTFSVLIAVIFYFAESGDRKKQKHYQAWQVINTAQGKGGSGGRIEALNELNADHEPLVGVDASGAFLQGVRLPHANLLRANLENADIRRGVLAFADLEYANLHSSNLRNSDLSNSKLMFANLEDADLWEANLSGADLAGATLDKADLRRAILNGLKWREIAGIKLANIFEIKNAPEGFTVWATQHGAVSIESDEQWGALLPKP